MTKKHFIVLARIAAMVRDAEDRQRVTRAMIDLGRASNANFDGERFIDAVNRETGRA